MTIRRVFLMPTVFLLAILLTRYQPIVSALDSAQDQKLSSIVQACGGPYRIAMMSQINNPGSTTYVNARAGTLEDVTRQIYTVCEADQILTTPSELTSSVNETEDKFLNRFNKDVSLQLAHKTLTQEQLEVLKNKLQAHAGTDIETQLERLTTDTKADKLFVQKPTLADMLSAHDDRKMSVRTEVLPCSQQRVADFHLSHQSGRGGAKQFSDGNCATRLP